MRTDVMIGGPDNGRAIQVAPDYPANTLDSPTTLGYVRYDKKTYVHKGGAGLLPGEYVVWVNGDLPALSEIQRLIRDGEGQPLEAN